MFKGFFLSFKKHPIATSIFLSPPLVLLGTEALEDFGCSIDYRLDPYLGLWHTLVWVAISSALVKFNREFCEEMIGDPPPMFSSRLLSLAFLSVNVNGVLGILLLIPYTIVVSLIGSSC